MTALGSLTSGMNHGGDTDRDPSFVVLNYKNRRSLHRALYHYHTEETPRNVKQFAVIFAPSML